MAQRKVSGKPVEHYLAHAVVTLIIKGEKLKRKKK